MNKTEQNGKSLESWIPYAQGVGWRFVPRAEAEARRSFILTVSCQRIARAAALNFGDLSTPKCAPSIRNTKAPRVRL